MIWLALVLLNEIAVSSYFNGFWTWARVQIASRRSR